MDWSYMKWGLVCRRLHRMDGIISRIPHGDEKMSGMASLSQST